MVFAMRPIVVLFLALFQLPGSNGQQGEKTPESNMRSILTIIGGTVVLLLVFCCTRAYIGWKREAAAGGGALVSSDILLVERSVKHARDSAAKISELAEEIAMAETDEEREALVAELEIAMGGALDAAALAASAASMTDGVEVLDFAPEFATKQADVLQRISKTRRRPARPDDEDAFDDDDYIESNLGTARIRDSRRIKRESSDATLGDSGTRVRDSRRVRRKQSRDALAAAEADDGGDNAALGQVRVRDSRISIYFWQKKLKIT